THVALVVVAGHGCVQVNADADFARADQLIEERTGASPGRTENDDGGAIIETVDGELTVERAVQIALSNNREFLAAFEEIGVSRADLVQSGLLTNPQISLMTRFPEGGGRADVEFGIAQEIADLWQIPVEKKVAQAQLEQTILRVAHRQ